MYDIAVFASHLSILTKCLYLGILHDYEIIFLMISLCTLCLFFEIIKATIVCVSGMRKEFKRSREKRILLHSHFFTHSYEKVAADISADREPIWVSDTKITRWTVQVFAPFIPFQKHFKRRRLERENERETAFLFVSSRRCTQALGAARKIYCGRVPRTCR